MRRIFASCVILVVTLGLVLPSDALADFTFPNGGFADEFVVGGVPNPTAIDWLPDGDLLIATRGGVLYRWNGIAGDPAVPLLDISGAVCEGSETGLLGLAVDPQFQNDPFIYLYYTHRRGNCGSGSGRANRAVRFTMNGQGALVDERVLIDNLLALGGNHNGGDLQFGADGLLYISVGDAGQDIRSGQGQDANANARRLYLLNGKILRIEKNGGIPDGNPFQGPGTARCASADVVQGQSARVSAQKQKKGKKNKRGRKNKRKRGKKKPLPPEPTTLCQEIFAFGLRNPYRIAFDPNDGGGQQRFFINDVGGNGFEEVNEGAIGGDYGWNIREGPCVINSGDCAPDNRFLEPIYAYGRGGGCTVITGGAFAPNNDWPGEYLFTDLGCATLFALTTTGSGADVEVFGTGAGATHLAFGPDGALYYTTFERGGEVHRIVDLP